MTMTLQAKYPGHCQLCDNAIAVGNEITRDNNERRHRSYVHAGCKPVAGTTRRAGYRVTVVKGDAKGYIAAGHSRQYVSRKVADAHADGLRQLGAEEVTVTVL
jgi:ribosomal protein S5